MQSAWKPGYYLSWSLDLLKSGGRGGMTREVGAGDIFQIGNICTFSCYKMKIWIFDDVKRENSKKKWTISTVALELMETLKKLDFGFWIFVIPLLFSNRFWSFFYGLKFSSGLWV